MGICIGVTGASGLVGQGLCQALMAQGRPVRALTRQRLGERPDEVVVGDINADTHWRTALSGVDVVVHCAARVHVMDRAAQSDQAAFREVNTHGTARLAEEAAAAGVGRLIFLSSIKVNGERASPQAPFRAEDPPRPADAYARSKAEAESRLWAIAEKTGLEVVVIRPPLVHGPGVGGNMATLLSAVRRGLPLPFGACDNRRSLIGLDNLINGICYCIDTPAAAGHVWLMRDARMPSTPDLVRYLAASLGRSPRLLRVPLPVLQAAAAVTGQSQRLLRLTESLCMDAADTQAALGWQPPLSLEEGLRRMVRAAVCDGTNPGQYRP